MHKLTGIFLAAVLVLSACATTQEIVPSDYKLPAYKEVTLDNGLRVLFVPDNSIPFLSLGLMIPKGVNYDPVAKSGLSNLTVNLLIKGTKKRSASKIADDLDFLGVNFSASASLESSDFGISGLSKFENEILDNYKEILFQPAFSKSEINRSKKAALAILEKIGESPEGLADKYAREYLYGSHPFAKDGLGSIRDIKSIRQKDILNQYTKLIVPDGAVLSVVGKYSPEFSEKIMAEFSKWKAKEVAAPVYPSIADSEYLQIRLMTKNSLKQSVVRFVHLGPDRSTEDYLELRLANAVFGGNFAARLMQEVRVKRGLTYGIYSKFGFGKNLGSFRMSSATRNEKVGELVSVTIEEYKKLVKDGITDDELVKAKNIVLGNFPKALETKEKLAGNLVQLRYYGISDDYLHDFVDNVQKISLSDVNRAIKRHLDPKKLKVLVLAPESAQEQLKDIGILEVKKSAY